MSVKNQSPDSTGIEQYSPSAPDELSTGAPPADPIVTGLLFAETGTLTFENIHWQMEHSQSFFTLADGWTDDEEPVLVYEAHLWDVLDRAYRVANQQLRARRKNGQTGLENW